MVSCHILYQCGGSLLTNAQINDQNCISVSRFEKGVMKREEERR